MKIKKIKLLNYRNYDNVEIEFNDNLNIIIGDNAQGKTNLLEAIYVLAVTKSFLSVNDRNLIKFNNKFSFIKGYLENKDSLNSLSIMLNENGKVVKFNEKEIRKLSDYISRMNVVIFSADSIRMIKESPASRRKYFNIQISQINKKYLKILNDYNTILRQRNEFLKVINLNKKSDIDYLDVLNDKYCDLSILLYDYRKKYINSINEYINKIFFLITGLEKIKINYNSNVISVDSENIKESLLNKLKKNINKEMQYRMTLIGPHRDDYSFSLNDKDLSLFGSQGQIRSAILAMKLSEVMLFDEAVNDSPILLLDDIFSELDIGKRNNILSYLNEKIQTIITTTDIENINENIRKKANVYKIENGKIISREIISKQEG